MAKYCVVFPQSPFADLAAFRVRHVLLLVSILTSNTPEQWFEDLAAFRVRHVLLLVSILTSNVRAGTVYMSPLDAMK